MSTQAKKAVQRGLTDHNAPHPTPPNSPTKIITKRKTPSAPQKASRKKTLREELGFIKNRSINDSEYAALHTKLTSIKMRQTKLERSLKSLTEFHNEQDELLKEATTAIQQLMFEEV